MVINRTAYLDAVTLERHADEALFQFVIGLLLGVVGGVLLGILFAPKSGRHTQTKIQRVVMGLPEHINQDLSASIRESNQQARTFFLRTRVRLESEMDKVGRAFRASRLAKAKRREALAAGGYEDN